MANRCDSIVGQSTGRGFTRPCRRKATYAYLTRDGEVFRSVCGQHYQGAGTERLLAPFRWEYAAVVDLRTLRAVEGEIPGVAS